jgi:type III pantothenate kinase
LNLVIDIGNTLSKLALFDKLEMIHVESVEIISSFLIEKITIKFQKIERCIISSVAGIPVDLINFLKKNQIDPAILDSKTPLPFKVIYRTPDTLGKDRIAAIAGADLLYPDQNVLVIDAGTAVKFDIINNKREYLGGNISPGLSMRFKALNQYTAKLPLLQPQDEFSLVGQSTDEAIINGVQNGLIFEIEGSIKEMELSYPGLIVLLTGGNARFFEKKVKRTVFVVPNLTLTGLNAILEFNKHG